MSKIKVGQIYGSVFTKERFVVTNDENRDDEEFYIITQKGKIYSKANAFSINHWLNLIAEYPTWQEAVNSKEFNNVAKD